MHNCLRISLSIRNGLLARNAQRQFLGLDDNDAERLGERIGFFHTHRSYKSFRDRVDDTSSYRIHISLDIQIRNASSQRLEKPSYVEIWNTQHQCVKDIDAE
jgi:hypothetical protein